MEVGCENSGRCLSMGSTIKCHCPSGWTGSLCDSEVLFGAPHFSGNAYLMVDPASLRGGLAKRGGGSPQEETKPQQQSITPISYIHLNFTTAHSDGMILWTSKDEDYFGVGVEGSLMKVVWGQGEEGQGAVVLLPAAIVSDGAWHSLTLQLQPHGGFPEERSVLDETRGNFKSGFSGCIKEFAWAPDQIGTVTNFTQFESENLGICEMFHP
ncbi:hypothetical protein AAG570_001908 [Ranatra chinensis]|uniref:EGF-like domain-containing protein n=1 Tax=Ranatra chinensis TaxID=642074 RepID=A0ABD0YSG0_9HEMI